ncbi:radical SAM/SPASM domain-containing protein [Chloroflexota bacterium]
MLNLKNDKNDYYRAVTRLLLNALRFRYVKLTGATEKPTVVSLALTNRCNSHCIMCNIWKRAGEQPDIKSLEIPPNEIIDILSRPMFSELVELDLTGGETHLRDDLVDIALGAGGLKNSYLPKLRSIIIASNGLLPTRIISNYQKILDGLKGTGIDLISVNSLDGIGETHDVVRGTRGAFDMVTRTISGLMALRKEYPNFFTGVKTTILPHNIDMLDAVLGFALEKNLFHIISPVFFTEARFRNTDKTDKLALNPAEYEKILKFLNRQELVTNYFYSRARRFLTTQRKPWVCTALHNYLYIDFDGQVYPCELISEPIGDVRKQGIEDIWHSSLVHHWRNKIGKLECCHRCAEPGAIRYSAYAEGFSYLRFLLELGKRKFSETLDGEGFSKYFNS